jgi:hypothetical protein
MCFRENQYCEILLKFIDTFLFWLKSDNNNGHFTLTPTCVSVRMSGMTGHIVIGAKIILSTKVVVKPKHIHETTERASHNCNTMHLFPNLLNYDSVLQSVEET